jgi:hypothetical protein
MREINVSEQTGSSWEVKFSWAVVVIMAIIAFGMIALYQLVILDPEFN